MHGDGVPYCVLGEEGDGFSHLKTVVFDKGGGEVGRGLFDVEPGEAFFGYGVCVAREGGVRVAVDGGVGWIFEEPFVGCEVAGDCATWSMAGGCNGWEESVDLRRISLCWLWKGIFATKIFRSIYM